MTQPPESMNQKVTTAKVKKQLIVFLHEKAIALQNFAKTLFPPEVRKRAMIGAAIVFIGLLPILIENIRLRKTVAGEDLITIVVAARQLEPGIILEKSDFDLKTIPKAYAHTKVIEEAQLDLLVGRQVGEVVRDGEMVLWSYFTQANKNAEKLSSLIPEGERAVAISVDDIASVGYFVSPGDHVDLFLATTRDGGRVVMPVLQNVTILGAGATLVGEVSLTDQYGRIIVSVTPQEAEMLLLAQRLGKLYLLLRNENDIAAEESFPIMHERELTGEETRKVIQQKRNQRMKTVQVIKGSG